MGVATGVTDCPTRRAKTLRCAHSAKRSEIRPFLRVLTDIQAQTAYNSEGSAPRYGWGGQISDLAVSFYRWILLRFAQGDWQVSGAFRRFVGVWGDSDGVDGLPIGVVRQKALAGQPQPHCRRSWLHTQAQTYRHTAQAPVRRASGECGGSVFRRKTVYGACVRTLGLPIVVSTRRGLRGCLERVSGDLSGLGLGPELARAEAEPPRHQRGAGGTASQRPRTNDVMPRSTGPWHDLYHVCVDVQQTGRAQGAPGFMRLPRGYGRLTGG